MDMRYDTFISKEWPRTKWKKLWLKTNIMDSTILIYPSMGDRSAKLFVWGLLVGNSIKFSGILRYNSIMLKSETATSARFNECRDMIPSHYTLSVVGELNSLWSFVRNFWGICQGCARNLVVTAGVTVKIFPKAFHILLYHQILKNYNIS